MPTHRSLGRARGDALKHFVLACLALYAISLRSAAGVATEPRRWALANDDDLAPPQHNDTARLNQKEAFSPKGSGRKLLDDGSNNEQCDENENPYCWLNQRPYVYTIFPTEEETVLSSVVSKMYVFMTIPAWGELGTFSRRRQFCRDMAPVIHIEHQGSYVNITHPQERGAFNDTVACRQRDRDNGNNNGNSNGNNGNSGNSEWEACDHEEFTEQFRMGVGSPTLNPQFGSVLWAYDGEASWISKYCFFQVNRPATSHCDHVTAFQESEHADAFEWSRPDFGANYGYGTSCTGNYTAQVEFPTWVRNWGDPPVSNHTWNVSREVEVYTDFDISEGMAPQLETGTTRTVTVRFDNRGRQDTVVVVPHFSWPSWLSVSVGGNQYGNVLFLSQDANEQLGLQVRTMRIDYSFLPPNEGKHNFLSHSS